MEFVVEIFCLALLAYWVILLLRVILSWVQAFGGSVPPAFGPAIRIIYQLTEPVLTFLRRYIPPLGMFDLSVLVLFLIIGVVQRVVCI